MNSCFGYITRLKGGKGDKRDSAPKPRVLRAVRYTNKFDLGAFHVGPKEFEIVMGNPLFLIKASTEGNISIHLLPTLALHPRRHTVNLMLRWPCKI